MNINQRKTLLVTVAAAVVTSSIGFVGQQLFNSEVRHATTTNLESQQVLFTQTAANEIEQYFYDIQKRIEIIAAMPAVRDAQRSESCNQALQNLVEINKQELNNLGRIDKNGTFICAVNRTIIGEPAAKYGTYFATIAKDPKHKPVMSPLIFPSGAGSAVIAVHVPVYDAKGQFSGTIGGAVYFEELQNRILHAVRPTKNSVTALYDANLDILYHPDPLLRSKNLLDPSVRSLFSPQEVITAFAADVKKPPTHGVIVYSLQGEKRRTAYRSVHVIGRYWTVGIAVPQKDIDVVAKDQKTGRIFLAITILFVITATALAYTLARAYGHSKKAKA